MQLKISRSDLLKSLSHIQGVVERRNTIPILSNVKLEANDNSLGFTATDMDLAISETQSAEISTPGNITVPAHTFYDIARKLPEDAEVNINYAGDNESSLKITAGNCNFSLPVIPANDFPIIEAGDITHSFEIARGDLIKLFDKSKFAISTEETRYYLNGIFLHDATQNGNNVLRAVATDGHRLARIDVPLPEGGKDIPKIIIPRKAIHEIKKVLDEAENVEKVKLSISATKIQVEIAGSIIVSKLIDGNFPDYERVIPTNNNNVLKTKVTPLKTAIDRVSTISSDKGRAVKLTLGDNKLVLSADNIDIGFAQEEVTVDYSAAKVETGFNSKYLLELTNVLEGDTAEFHFADSSSPTLVQDNSDSSALFVIMPMRI